MDTTTTATTTTTDAALLRLIWLASPALPVGGFSYSEGLEAAVEAGLVHDEVSAGEWLAQQLHASLARADLAVVGSAVCAARANDGERLAQLDDWVRQTRETSELRQQTEQMGRSLGDWARSVGWGDAGSVGWGDAGTPAMRDSAGVRFAHHQPTKAAERTYPVAFATAAASTEASVRQVALAYAFGWSENMMQAAIKSVPLGQSAGQRILARLASEIPAAVDHALALDDAQRQAFTPMLAILSAQHETQYSRLFRS
ncbi:urease accessory protein UreF [Ramlibacter ginsenosidimutans]|uniref:Urease accessory protein UreF n=1 Tax=Ramlibacter ginsenosidimutans TaxID=502333 RepID=A0A934TRK8_9BURK|nr:urease accessory UreF family protein [Ramlibacter ginsenosidimutans]MBK6006251.1 urease accessory protein UreF [Ramlibacter ginsenosidimutans]